jgi:ferritin
MPVASILKPAIKKMLNEAIYHELYASNLYKHLANNMQRLGMFGAQKYFLNESADELVHYQKIVDYINDTADLADIAALPSFSQRFFTIGDALNEAYKTELALLNKYIEFYEKADCMTEQFLLQFIEIQKKSIGEFGDLIAYWDKIDVNRDVEMDEFLSEKTED